MTTPQARRRARPSPPPAGPPFVGALLRLCWQKVRQEMTDAVQAAGYTDLQDAHLAVFQYPGPDGLRPSELARQMRMSRQATNYLIAQLEVRGYLERRTARAAEPRRIRLTRRGHAVVATMQEVVQRVETAWAEQVGRRRFDVFLQVLRQLAK